MPTAKPSVQRSTIEQNSMRSTKESALFEPGCQGLPSDEKKKSSLQFARHLKLSGPGSRISPGRIWSRDQF